MKIRVAVDLVIRLSPCSDEGRRRFKAIKKQLKRMDDGDLAKIVLEGVERQLQTKPIGFKPDADC